MGVSNVYFISKSLRVAVASFSFVTFFVRTFCSFEGELAQVFRELYDGS